MKELTFLVVIILIGLAGYLLYNTGVIKDVSSWILKFFDGIKIPEIKTSKSRDDYDDLNVINKKQEDYFHKILEKLNEYKSYTNKNYNRDLYKNKSSKGDKITKEELDYLWNGISTRRSVPCFTCESADMYSGVQTGNSQYWYCPVCGQTIILSLLSNKKDGAVCYNLGIDKSKIK